MSLFEEHKAERRARILAAARRADRGARLRRAHHARPRPREPGLGADALQPLRRQAGAAARRARGHVRGGGRGASRRCRTGNVVDRALATCDAGNADLLAVPRYSRELILLFLTSPRDGGRSAGHRPSATSELMADILRDGQKAGDIEPWVDAVACSSRRMFAHYQLAMIEWARGEIDADEFQVGDPLRHVRRCCSASRAGEPARQLTRRLREGSKRR